MKLEQRRALSALKEKEMLNSEHQKTLLAKSKLESLCRELQKHSKMIKDEAMKRAQMEETKRKEVADSFQSTIDEVGPGFLHLTALPLKTLTSYSRLVKRNLL